MQDAPKAVWSIPYVSVAFFPNLKQNFIVYCSTEVSSCSDCIFKLYQLWQSGFSRMYSNCCCSCSFEPEIIKIGQSSHKMYSNKILNFQESTTILNACTKTVWKFIEGTTYIFHLVCRTMRLAWVFDLMQSYLLIKFHFKYQRTFPFHISKKYYFRTLSVELRICCVPCREIRLPKRCVLGMTLNCIWLWGLSSVDLGMWSATSLPLLPGSLWPVVIIPVKVPSRGQIDLLGSLLWV